jgi:hypothetical protein
MCILCCREYNSQVGLIVDKAENINASPNFYLDPLIDILMILHLPNFFGSIVTMDAYIYIYIYIYLEL